MTFNYSKLNGKIVEMCGTQYNFSQQMGLSERTISLKINNKVSWKDSEIYKACRILDIPLDQISKYFFAPKVQEVEQN